LSIGFDKAFKEMSKLGRTVVLTFIAWLAVTISYAYYWVSSILAEPGVPVYERNGFLPLLGFAIYRFPFLLIGLLVVLVLELLIVPGSDRNPPSMV
jgi:hypothetical protein